MKRDASAQNAASLRSRVAAVSSGGGSAAPAITTAEEEVSRIQALIKESPDLINAPDQIGETLLQRAAAKGETAVVKLLLDSGAAVAGPKLPGLTALHYAAGNGHKAVVDLLLSRGAKVDARSESGEGWRKRVGARRPAGATYRPTDLAPFRGTFPYTRAWGEFPEMPPDR